MSPRAFVRVGRVPIEELRAGERVLDRAATHYLVDVLRLPPGARFVAFDPEHALECDAELVETRGAATACRLSEPRRALMVPEHDVELVQGLGKGDKPEQVIRAATALGVASVLFVLSERSIAKPGERGERRRERWHRVALDAARQSGRGNLPRIAGPVAVDEAFGAAPGESRARFCLDPAAPRSLGTALAELTPGARLAVAVGPEGGFTALELERAGAAGFARVRLGRLTLRTELAAIAALSVVLGWAEREP
jgi:16S rRNA (uracil1498-N3)-methyltransferase